MCGHHVYTCVCSLYVFLSTVIDYYSFSTSRACTAGIGKKQHGIGINYCILVSYTIRTYVVLCFFLRKPKLHSSHVGLQRRAIYTATKTIDMHQMSLTCVGCFSTRYNRDCLQPTHVLLPQRLLNSPRIFAISQCSYKTPSTPSNIADVDGDLLTRYIRLRLIYTKHDRKAQRALTTAQKWNSSRAVAVQGSWLHCVSTSKFEHDCHDLGLFVYWTCWLKYTCAI